MRTSTFITTAAALLSGVAEGYLQTIGLPQTIKPGDVWEAPVTTAIMQPRQDLMIWGIGDTSSVYAGSISREFHRTNLRQELSGGYNDTIPNISIPESLNLAPGEYGIQAVILEWAGAANTPSLETWFWNVTIGDVTSEERVWQSALGVNSKRCNLV
ncbi:unnamed protein product [Colletotrichum noveboracense]|uniref:Uncharacterized protein n=1 Tax=Colletotrichum noveboracense TaxID=2664923 RepID=A0A9W4RZV3_9PEZI|nr:hypothetical protein K456DRAFT_1766542 [Colletotrichum gloeosporioides 23]KAJ0269667.1 hypothetical protein COL940_012274 [Colletotrichum noveboracense]KAJ0291416.1 hypothetical protein CBS470a_003413 [Colletotrichum nupharicola]KAJ0321378.1 hypothetical protein Brms1b_002735 [Colletotrichum noveboracense]CAI0650694.1 unnamed protein product [Colletotrichum noveboracense]